MVMATDLAKGLFSQDTGNYEITGTISQTTGTSVFAARNKITGEEVEIIQSSQHSKLDHEVHHYNMLTGGIGIPFVHWYPENGLLALTKLGPNLENLFRYCESHFSLKTILLIADQIICRFKLVHERSLFHGNVKPKNFRIGTGKQGMLIYITGFLASSAEASCKTFSSDLSCVGYTNVLFEQLNVRTWNIWVAC